MAFGIWIGNLRFKDGSVVQLGRRDVVLVVGPNNAGKSTVLSELFTFLDQPNYTNSVILGGLELEGEGTPDESNEWLTTNTNFEQELGGPVFAHRGHRIRAENLLQMLVVKPPRMINAARLFVDWLKTDSRLSLVNPAPNIPYDHRADSPLVTILREPAYEKLISERFRLAFGQGVHVHRNAGSVIPLHIGDIAPDIAARPFEHAHWQAVQTLPRLHEQGDGMRSFAGVLVHTLVAPRPLLLIDEPEAFLHPPQARYLGRAIVEDGAKNRQTFLATHSGDVVRGALDAGTDNVRVLRFRRTGNVTEVRDLDASQVSRIWKDPLLRQSNILDGLFHDKVVVCEGDADCQFYGAVLQAVSGDAGPRPHDIMFTHCGGKARIPMVIRALRSVAVPTAAVCDFDLLNDEATLRATVESFGGSWETFQSDWRTVKSAVDSKKPELSLEALKKKIVAVVEAWGDQSNLREARSVISGLLKRASPWAEAKAAGLRSLPSGQPYVAAERLLNSLAALGIYVVPVGEIEQFCKSVGDHGPRWLHGVLERDLARDSELGAARDFVRAFAKVS